MARVSPRYRKVVSDVHHADPTIDFVGREGGYILGGSHNIQADCPDENLMAMVDEAMWR